MASCGPESREGSSSLPACLLERLAERFDGLGAREPDGTVEHEEGNTASPDIAGGRLIACDGVEVVAACQDFAHRAGVEIVCGGEWFEVFDSEDALAALEVGRIQIREERLG
ncbi:MAG: hypothetical protein RLZZ163_777 [Actinomycetota bacterium]